MDYFPEREFQRIVERYWRIYRDIALLLIGRARLLHAGEPLDVGQAVAVRVGIVRGSERHPFFESVGQSVGVRVREVGDPEEARLRGRKRGSKNDVRDEVSRSAATVQKALPSAL